MRGSFSGLTEGRTYFTCGVRWRVNACGAVGDDLSALPGQRLGNVTTLRFSFAVLKVNVMEI